MGRYGPVEAPPPPPPTKDDDGLTRWSFRRKILAVIASVGMVAAFVFNFLSPTSSGFKKDQTSTTTSSVSAATSVATVPTPTTLSTAPATSLTPTTQLTPTTAVTPKSSSTSAR